jgi:hypothetical protein
MGYPRQPPFLFYDSAKKCPVFFSGAEVGDSPHGPAGSCIYYTQSILAKISMETTGSSWFLWARFSVADVCLNFGS